jgi:eukaryotic-like serine/threonine-protein kinase
VPDNRFSQTGDRMVTCPDRHELESLLDNHLTDTDRERLELHVEQCGACQQVLEFLTATTDSGLTHERVVTPPVEGPGTQFGPYKLVEKIGEGGMGAVYRAAQEKPVRRQVAIKIIKPGMDCDQICTRFNAERQALALMDHPGIAKVLDAGSTDAGRPYFVMELVNGVPITDYCDQAQLTPADRLALFVSVCQAVQHAHQKGIIHRDIKPSNLLVASIDGKPVPRVIDFGLAKAIDQSLTEKTVCTEFGAIMGTLEYMSPEQAGLFGLDIDVRSDIYSLGVVLYELLAGSTPLERGGILELDHTEILRRIKEDDPPRPSARLSGSGEKLTSIAQRRRTDPFRLTRAIAGDLDWIVMKALEKDRSRRYESASGFARDVQRFLDGDPVEACPPSATYRFSKFARKHRSALATGGSFAVMLVLMTAVSGWQAIRATSAERLTRNERDRARTAEAEAVTEAENARRSAAESKAVRDFLLNKLLASARPEGQEEGLGKDVTIRQAVDAVQPKISVAFKDQPAVEASVRETIGTTYYFLSESAAAIREYERAAELETARLGPGHPDTLRIQNSLVLAYWQAGRTAEAIPLGQKTLEHWSHTPDRDGLDELNCRNNLAMAYHAAGRTTDSIVMHEEVLRRYTSRLGANHDFTLTARNNLAVAYYSAGRSDEAITLHEATLKQSQSELGGDHPATLSSRSNLANAYLEAGRTAEAIALDEETLILKTARLGPHHRETLITRNSLALGYRNLGQTARAIAMQEETLKLCTMKLGADNRETLLARHNLALSYQDAARTAEAIALDEETLKVRKAKLGNDHPHTLSSRNSLAAAYWSSGQFERAIVMHEEILKLKIAKLGPEHPAVLTTQNNLALAYKDAGRTADSVAMNLKTLRQRTAILSPDHPNTLQSRTNLAGAYWADGRNAESIALGEPTLKILSAKLGLDHSYTFSSRNTLARAYLSGGRAAEAIAIWEAMIPSAATTLGPMHPNTLGITHLLCTAYESVGRWAGTEPRWRELIATRRKAVAGDSPLLAADLAGLGRNLLEQHKYVEAEPTLRECLKIREAKAPDDWRTFDTLSQLGGSLLGQQKYTLAEPLVVRGYEGIKSRESRIPVLRRASLTEALERVARLYDAWGKPVKAALWRQKAALATELPADVFAL